MMLTTNRRTRIVLLTLAVNLAGCVSVKLSAAGGGGKRATGVTYSAPTEPLEHEKRDDIDAAWKNPRNGNLLSYLSDCQDESDPGLDSIVQGSLSGLSEVHLESTQNPTMEGREARRVLATGKVDGVPSKIDLLVFKRNQCIYILSYVGVKEAFDQNHPQFDKFISGFRAP